MLIWIRYGTRLYGRALSVPGVFHVATEFFHIWYIPLVPMRSWIVFNQSRGSWQGKPISWNPRSILCAWGRAACVVGAVVLSFMALAPEDQRRPTASAVRAPASTSLRGGPAVRTSSPPMVRVRQAGAPSSPGPAAAGTVTPIGAHGSLPAPSRANPAWLTDTGPRSVINISTLAALCAGFFVIPTLPGIRRASRAQAEALCRKAGLPKTIMDRVDTAVRAGSMTDLAQLAEPPSGPSRPRGM